MDGNGGQDEMAQQALIDSIRSRLDTGTSSLKPSEAVMMLEWAVRCADNEGKAKLLELLDNLGGVDLLRAAVGPIH